MIPNIQTTPLNSKTFNTFALFGLVIFFSAEASRWLGVEGLTISIIWPASGLMLGAGVVMGYPIVLFSAVVLAAWPASIMVVMSIVSMLYVGFSLFGLGGLPELETINQTVRSVLFLTGLAMAFSV